MSGGDHRISEASTVCLCPDLRKKKTPTTTTPFNDSFHKTFRGSEQWGAAWSAIVIYIYIIHPAPLKGCQINPKGWLIDTP